MTSLNNIPEDPTGFRIEPSGDGWRWVRIADQQSKGGFKTREAAIKAANAQDREPT